MPGSETVPTHADSFIVFSEEDAESPDIQVLNWPDSWYEPLERQGKDRERTSQVGDIRARLYRILKVILGHY